MSVEIRELHIRVLVNAGASGNRAAAGGDDADEKDEIVAECVEQVLQILRDKMDR